MGRRHTLKPFRLLSAQSLAADFQTTATKIEQLDSIVYLITTDSVTDNTGSFDVQVRLVIADNNEATDWVTLTLTSTPTLADTDDQITITVENQGWTEIRLIFTAAGGTPDGTADVYVSGSTRSA